MKKAPSTTTKAAAPGARDKRNLSCRLLDSLTPKGRRLVLNWLKTRSQQAQEATKKVAK